MIINFWTTGDPSAGKPAHTAQVVTDLPPDDPDEAENAAGQLAAALAEIWGEPTYCNLLPDGTKPSRPTIRKGTNG